MVGGFCCLRKFKLSRNQSGNQSTQWMVQSVKVEVQCIKCLAVLGSHASSAAAGNHFLCGNCDTPLVTRLTHTWFFFFLFKSIQWAYGNFADFISLQSTSLWTDTRRLHVKESKMTWLTLSKSNVYTCILTFFNLFLHPPLPSSCPPIRHPPRPEARQSHSPHTPIEKCIYGSVRTFVLYTTAYTTLCLICYGLIQLQDLSYLLQRYR